MSRQALCTSWRHHRSADRVTELGHVLEFATSFVRLLGSQLTVQWSGQRGLSHTDCISVVALDAGPIARCRAPFSDARVDIVMGEAIHEAGHCAFTTPTASDALRAAEVAGALGPREGLLLRTLFNVLEDGYIEQRLRREWPNLAPYIAALNAHLFPARVQQRLRAAVTVQLDAAALYNALLGFAVLDWPPVSGPPAAADALDTLYHAAQTSRMQHTVADRVQTAMELVVLFQRLFPNGQPSPAQPPLRKPCTALGPARPLSARLAAAVDAALAGGASRAQILVLAPAPSRGTASASEHVALVASSTDPPLDSSLLAEARPVAERVRRALRGRALRAGRPVRGLSSGRLSLRRLPRLALGQTNVFEQRRRDRPQLALGVLLDCSGSTKPIWRTCQLCAVAVAEALQHARDVRLVIAAYQGQDGACRLTLLYDPRTRRLSLGAVSPSGATPSAQALRAIAPLLWQTSMRDRVLLHFTDGQPDDPGAVREAIADLSRAGTIIWTLAAGDAATPQLLSCYGRNVRLLADVNALPQALADLAAAALTRRS